MTRVAVFVDYQNTYMGLRQAHGWTSRPAQVGQVFPRRLGVLLCDRGRAVDPHRQLEYVKVFRGEPSAKYDKKGQSACQRQVRFWGVQTAVEPITRPLKYYEKEWDARGRPTAWDVKEKGIDVLIALGMVLGARNDEFDTAVLMSADSDLAPAVDAVRSLGKRCEVGAWHGPVRRNRLPGSAWCHWLTEADYRLVADPTDYTQPQPGQPSPTP